MCIRDRPYRIKNPGCVSSGAPGRRDFAQPESILSASTMWADPAGTMSRVLVSDHLFDHDKKRYVTEK
eukprot:5444277-Prymnesium_polylepis.1